MSERIVPAAVQDHREPPEPLERVHDHLLQQERHFPRKTFRPKPPSPGCDGKLHELFPGLLRNQELQGDVQLHPKQVRGRLLQPTDDF